MQMSQAADSPLLSVEEGPPAEVLNASGRGGFLLVCEHASRRMPASLGDLGLSAEDLRSHIAWDPGALSVAEKLAAALDSPLVAGRFSRLAYDCNRPPDAPDAISSISEGRAIPGNADLDATARAARAREIYAPFQTTLSEAVRHTANPAIVTIHSFTPIYLGVARSVELGVLHDDDPRLADAVLAIAPGVTDLSVERNKPYGPEDGVTHTLRTHALPAGLLNVMLEIRNDLISDEAACAAMASSLARVLESALADVAAVNPARQAGG